MTDYFAQTWLKLNICLLLVFYPLHCSAVTEDQFSVHGLSAFKEDHATLLESWLTQGVNATRATLGIYPLLFHYICTLESPINLCLGPTQGEMEKAAYIFMLMLVLV
ncbi:hypothetical protein [uncultured Paraglaciecola sp.]|uniref:hypothetical protein n=1 Tax=uncultured Paraglaciecola sp. TaxID=1765024 RepID=UPI0025F883C4|nr:hypothetical protein [uncultured Paraglaciecola sp.]